MDWFEEREYLHKWAAGYLLADEDNPEPELPEGHAIRTAINAVFGSTHPRTTLQIIGKALDALDEKKAADKASTDKP